MPDFVAALAAAALFCACLLVLNALTHLALRLHWVPAELAANGLAQYGLASIGSAALWRRATRREGRGARDDVKDR